MRVLTSISLLAGTLLVASACAPAGPFQGISAVKVRHITESGLKDKVFKEAEQQNLIGYLYQSTEVPEEQTLRELLQTTYLIEVSDAVGDRSFELYTTQNLKGNKGKYYVNTCIHDIIRSAK